MTTAFQANSLAPMGWNLEPESKIDRHHHCSTSIVVWTDSCTRLFGPRWVGVGVGVVGVVGVAGVVLQVCIRGIEEWTASC